MKWKKVKSLSHVWLLLTPWTIPWQAPHPWYFAGKNTRMHCHFRHQIVQANCSILLDGLCAHLHIPTLHPVYSHGHFEAAPKNLSPDRGFVDGPWKDVRGWVPGPPHSSLPSSGQEPFQVSPVSQIPHFAPTKFSGLKWDMGLRRPGGNHLQHSGSSVPDTALEVRYLQWKPGLILFPPGSLAFQLPKPWGSRELKGGWASHALLYSPPALHIWPRQRSAERMEGMSAALSAQKPAPTLYGWGDHGALEDKQNVVPGGLPQPCRIPRPWTHSKGGPSVYLAMMASQPSPEVSLLSLFACSDPLLQKVESRISSWFSHHSLAPNKTQNLIFPAPSTNRIYFSSLATS